MIKKSIAIIVFLGSGIAFSQELTEDSNHHIANEWWLSHPVAKLIVGEWQGYQKDEYIQNQEVKVSPSSYQILPDQFGQLVFSFNGIVDGYYQYRDESCLTYITGDFEVRTCLGEENDIVVSVGPCASGRYRTKTKFNQGGQRKAVEGYHYNFENELYRINYGFYEKK